MSLFKIGMIALVVSFTSSSAVQASIVEQFDLNIIQQTGNPSDGLRFLDMTYSDGETLVQALANAQAVYPNARLATPSEWDDLFQAANVTYLGSETASQAFMIGFGIGLTNTNSGASEIADKLGETGGPALLAWTDPDGSSAISTTNDLLQINSSNFTGAVGEASSFQSSISPSNGSVGWLIVSEATAVPEPSSIALLGLIGCMRVLQRRKR